MKIIEKLSDMIEEELEDAEKYAMCALKHKEDDPDLADVFHELAKQEMEHHRMLHEQVVREIRAYRKAHGDPPEGMQTLYDYLHGKHVDKAVSVERAIAMYKE